MLCYVTTECHLFLLRKLSFSPLLFFSYPAKQAAHRRIRKSKPLTTACHLGATLRRKTILHVSSDTEILTTVASRRGLSLMVESGLNA